MFNRKRAVKATFIHDIDQLLPIDFSEPWNSITPPSDIPRI